METQLCGTPPMPGDVPKRKGARAGWKGGREPKLLVELADARAVVPRARNDYVHGASGVAHRVTQKREREARRRGVKRAREGRCARQAKRPPYLRWF